MVPTSDILTGGQTNWRSFDCAQCSWTVVASDPQEERQPAHQKQDRQSNMRLTIHVSDAAYMDKTSSDTIIYELIPKYSPVTDEAIADASHPSTSAGPSSWISSPCVRQSDMLLALHQHLQRKHPHFFLPLFPASTRKTPGWGSEGHLQLLKRRLERYFSRLLTRPAIEHDVALHDFMAAKSERGGLSAPEGQYQGAGLWGSFERWLKGQANAREMPLTVPEDRITVYQPLQGERFAEECKYHDSLDKSVSLRKRSLKSVSAAVDGVVQAVQRYSESLGRISKCLHEVTSAHMLHSVATNESEASRRPKGLVHRRIDSMAASTSLQDDAVKGTERRFRELGDRFVDLINQLQPGLGTIHQVASTTVVEVMDDQLGELGHVRAYVNRVILVLKRYDQAISKRIELEGKRPGSDAKPDLVARHQVQLEEIHREEEALAAEFSEKSANLRSEMDHFWDDTSREFFLSISQTIKASLEVGRLQVDALRAWFPPTNSD